ncbi:Protein C6orf168 [Candidatus Phaeomarinobacter ectocarpi]|uniref:Protein C6orf168 n=1 Tax=Candidatus Phaeomarinibacter ectocarpi TaxID=1458461 RepID=X5MM55_9HYPH|nr:glutathione S-transferase family protein [Candidatus Phaeomarinobacter ectocarpi]CDO60080.1 Protein C6orf168 [Candidatus Phaeomarinobacter ectocarpi]
MSTPQLDVYGFPAADPKATSASPFTTKIECLLRLAGLPYRMHVVTNPGKTPRGKLPYLEDGTMTVSDSEHIVAHLKAARGVDLDVSLTPLERAQSHALQRMIEERLYWIIVYSRWIDPANDGAVYEQFFGSLPPVLRGLIYRSALKTTKAALHHQGLGRHTADEIYAFAARDLEAISQTLGDKPFLFGDAPTLADVVAFASLTNMLRPDFKTALRGLVEVRPNLVAYETRMGALYEDGASIRSSSQ